jgi:hypothetical protein
MKVASFELFTSERRILRKIAEAQKIGIPELERQLADDPAIGALGAILRNLSLAQFVAFVRPNSVSASAAGCQYLQELRRG